MERKIGEIFEYNGEWHQCVEQPEKYDKTVCNLCDFHGIGNCELDRCSGTYRSDKKDVVFKKLEKVGEPYSCNYYGDNRLIMMQEYNLYNLDDVINEDKIQMYITDFKHKRIAIEIKQNKEDMDEKELNLKPFDIQKAREGKPVCTRDGRKARIICFDAKCGKSPIIALIENGKNEELHKFHRDGKLFGLDEDEESFVDLMMLPEKRSGWIVINKEGVYDKETAEKIARETTADVIRIQKIYWEE